ncbi:MAG: hypothetical protein VB022_10890 [Rikenellaceae bacterium]|nr:hypothetical protein [Rikenellaceae bacterium]
MKKIIDYLKCFINKLVKRHNIVVRIRVGSKTIITAANDSEADKKVAEYKANNGINDMAINRRVIITIIPISFK